MKISFTSFDSTRGLGQPGDQTGSRNQTVILPFTLWDKWDICGRRLRKLRQSVLYFSSVIVNRNLANGSFKKWKWFPEDLTFKTIISQYNITKLNKYAVSQCPAAGHASFSKYSMSGSSYFVDVELIQTEKTNWIVLCFLRSLLLNIVWNSGTAQQLMQLSHVAVVGFRTRFSKYSLSGSTVFLEFWVNLCRITDSSSATLSQIIKKFPNIFLNSVC